LKESDKIEAINTWKRGKKMKIWKCGPHLYSIINGKMRIAQPTVPEGDENVLTKEDEEKVKANVFEMYAYY